MFVEFPSQINYFILIYCSWNLYYKITTKLPASPVQTIRSPHHCYPLPKFQKGLPRSISSAPRLAWRSSDQDQPYIVVILRKGRSGVQTATMAFCSKIRICTDQNASPGLPRPLHEISLLFFSTQDFQLLSRHWEHVLEHLRSPRHTPQALYSSHLPAPWFSRKAMTSLNGLHGGSPSILLQIFNRTLDDTLYKYHIRFIRHHQYQHHRLSIDLYHISDEIVHILTKLTNHDGRSMPIKCHTRNHHLKRPCSPVRGDPRLPRTAHHSFMRQWSGHTKRAFFEGVCQLRHRNL
jgi:hypothetical protein